MEPILLAAETIDILGSPFQTRTYPVPMGALEGPGGPCYHGAAQQTRKGRQRMPPARPSQEIDILRLTASEASKESPRRALARVIRCAGAPGGGSRPASASYRKAIKT